MSKFQDEKTADLFKRLHYIITGTFQAFDLDHNDFICYALNGISATCAQFSLSKVDFIRLLKQTEDTYDKYIIEAENRNKNAQESENDCKPESVPCDSNATNG